MAALYRPRLLLALFAVLWGVPSSYAQVESPALRREQSAAAPAKRIPLRQVEMRVTPMIRMGAFYIGPEYKEKDNIYRLKYIIRGVVIWVDVDASTGQIVGSSRIRIPPAPISPEILKFMRERRGVDQQDYAPRVPKSEYSPVGVLVDIDEGGQGTGTLVSPCHVITVAHAFDNAAAIARRVAANPYPLRFMYGPPVGNKLFSNVIKAAPVVWGDWNGAYWREDWMLLRLEQCVGGADYIPLLAIRSNEVPEKSVIKAGFPAVRGFKMGASIDPACSVVDEPGGPTWATSCAMAPGDSGGPHMIRRSGRLYIIALNSYGVPDTGPNNNDWHGGTRGVVPVSLFYERVAPILAQDTPAAK